MEGLLRLSTCVCFSTVCTRTLLSVQFNPHCSDLRPDYTRSFTAWDFGSLVHENLSRLFLTESGTTCVVCSLEPVGQFAVA